jgi:superfamily II DNA or RNA helicase
LTVEDKEALERGIQLTPAEIAEKHIIDDILKLCNTLSKNDRHFFNCISYLIATKKIEFVAIVPKANHPGIAHQKFGIFKDKQLNRVAFSGSINFSSTALFKNLEAISCYKSWDRDSSDNERIEYYQNLFDKTWQGQSEFVQVVPIEKAKVVIREKFPTNDIALLLNEELSLLDFINNEFNIPISLSNKLNTVKRNITQENKSKPSYPSTNEKRSYQDVAVKNWIASSYKGLFEMATGTGKTIAGLFASVKLFEKLNKIVLLILVPTISLAEQWVEEVQKFTYKEIVLVSSNNSYWEIEIQAGLNSFRLESINHLVIISTYDSYKSKRFKEYYDRLPAETMLIADEAHYMGAPEILNKLPHKINFRLALSATPHRHFDDSGTKKFLSFFHVEDQPTFTFGMKEAIRSNFLCQYKLYPYFAELNEKEYELYLELTDQISRRAHISRKKEFTADVVLERLLQERRMILNKAASKKEIVGRIIDEMRQKGEVHHTLVYCPEGVDEIENSSIIDEYGKYLAFEKGLRIAQFTGSTSPQRRAELLKQFDEGSIQCLLAMKCLDEGVDVRRTESAIFVSSSTNPRQYVQRRGRVLRTHDEKPFAFLYDIITVPPQLELEDPKAIDVNKIILTQEFSRFKEFAEDSLNFVEAITPIKKVCDDYKIKI